MVMGYFDESANPHADFICMSGYLADDDNFGALTADWNVLLAKYRIPYLHLADFIASQGVYEELGWSGIEKNSQNSPAVVDFVVVSRRPLLAGVGVGFT